MFFIYELRSDGMIGVGDTEDNAVDYMTAQDLTTLIKEKGFKIQGITQSGTLKPFKLVFLGVNKAYVGKTRTEIEGYRGGITFKQRCKEAELELIEHMEWKCNHQGLYSWINRNYNDDISELPDIKRKDGYMIIYELHKGDDRIFYDIRMD